MLTRQELLSNRELLIDKTRGALCGLAIGDSFGDAARTPPTIQRDYGFITDFHKGDSGARTTRICSHAPRPSSKPAEISPLRTW